MTDLLQIVVVTFCVTTKLIEKKESLKEDLDYEYDIKKMNRMLCG